MTRIEERQLTFATGDEGSSHHSGRDITGGMGMSEQSWYNNLFNAQSDINLYDFYMPHQGFYTELLLDQIRNSQEERQNEIYDQGPTESYMAILAGGYGYEEAASLQVPGFAEASTDTIHEAIGDVNMQMMPGDVTDNDETTRTLSNFESHKEPIEDEHEDDYDDYDNGIWKQDIFGGLQLDEVGLLENNNATQLATSDNIITGNIANGNDGNGSQELTDQQVEDFICAEEQATSEGNNADDYNKYTPQIGMQFKDRDEVVVAHVTRTQDKKKNGEIYRQEMRCHRYGKQSRKQKETIKQDTLAVEVTHDEKKKRKTNVQIKTDCKCVMVVIEKMGFWEVVKLDLDHNHELSPQNRNQLFSGKTYMSDMEKDMIRTLNDTNVPTRKMVALLSLMRADLTALPYKTKDVQNLRTKINREVTGNDMTQALEYFKSRKSEDPSFYYKIDLDNNLKVRNIFWREGISLEWYAEYGDCVSFDTTYMTNRYNIPFAPFVGVTGHAHTCLFACAFLADETTETFKWVFNTFLESMGNKHPETIITDQDKAMRSAIQQVFPNTKHQNCFFHIKQKCYNKNLKVFAVNKGLPETFEDIVNFSVTKEEFEYLWKKMIADYKLENNKYFNKMWEMQERFIPVYFKNNFFPFLQSTGRSEGTNARFKENIGPTYSVVSFLREYQRIVDTIKVKEQLEDNVSKQKTPKELQYGYTIEEQAIDLYNRNIYLKFMNQLKQTEKFKYKEIEKGKTFEVWYKANQIQKRERIRKYVVITDLTEGNEDFSCICGKFDKDGILCAHILKVIVEEEIRKIPERYFKDRWRKKERKVHAAVREENNKTHCLLRFNMLSRKAAVLTSKGAKQDEATNYLMAEFERIDQYLDMLLAGAETGEPSNSTAHEEETQDWEARGRSYGQEIVVIGDPVSVQKKGRPRNPTRLMPLVEQERKKMAKTADKNKNKKAPSSSKQPKGNKRTKK